MNARAVRPDLAPPAQVDTRPWWVKLLDSILNPKRPSGEGSGTSSPSGSGEGSGLASWLTANWWLIALVLVVFFVARSASPRDDDRGYMRL